MGDASEFIDETYDVVIVGAGISGVNAAYRIQEAFPHFRYTILEARDVIGGTWSFFKYPGIRSDSEIAGFAFSWEPWNSNKILADGPSIMSYLEDTVLKHGIDKHVTFNTMLTHLDWQSELQKWVLTTDSTNGGGSRTLHSRFMIMCTGYYDYKTPYQAQIPGLDNFEGLKVHPQFWPSDLDYTDKNVVVIGSGATAVTIVPEMSKKAKHVTMLQRSPGHFLVMPSTAVIDGFLRRWLPNTLAYAIIRIRILVIGFLVVSFCRLFPGLVTKLLRMGVQKALPEGYPIEPNFVPKYAPFEQRLCITPDGDFFQAIRAGKADVETGEVETMKEKDIILKSGKKIENVDIIVTATGLKMFVIGGVKPSIDGKPVDIASKFVWRSTCLQDVPNLCFFIGYVDNSWTLGSDSSARLFVRLIKQLQTTGNTSFTPTMSEQEQKDIVEVPLLKLDSGYVERVKHTLPRTASTAPWQPRWHYFKDTLFAGYGNINKGMKLVRVET